MVRVFIDAGHGGKDPGSVGNGLKEKDVVLDIAKRLRIELLKYENVSVKMSRTTDKYVSLSQRAKMANDWKADLFVSIHINAGGGVGYEDFIHNSLSSNSKTSKIQTQINKAVIKETGWRNRGRKKSNFLVLRQTKMNAILTENGFIDNKNDAKKLKSSSFKTKVAKGHAIGIAKSFKLKKKTTSKPKKNKTSNKKLYKVQIGAFKRKDNADNLSFKARARGFDRFVVKEGGLYKVQIGAFSKKKNADNLAKKAKKAGFDVFITT